MSDARRTVLEVLTRTSDQVMPKKDLLPRVVSEYTGFGSAGDSIRVIAVEQLEPNFEEGPPLCYVIPAREIYVYGSSTPLEGAASVKHFTEGNDRRWAVCHTDGGVIFTSSHIVLVEV